MVVYNLIFPICMYVTGLLSFSLKFKSFLLMMLSLEYVVLSIYWVIFMISSSFSLGYFSLIFVSMMVCESVMGLTLLINLVRSFGSDYFQVLNLLW